MIENTNPFVMSIEEARHRLCISRSLMYEAVRRNEIPSIRVGRRLLIPVYAIEEMMKQSLESCQLHKKGNYEQKDL